MKTDPEICAVDAFAKLIETILKKGGKDDKLARFNSPDFCLDDIMHRTENMMHFLHIVELLAKLKGRTIEDVTLGKIPPGAVDGYIGFFSVALRSQDDCIKKCDGNHAGMACRDAQCWLRDPNKGWT